MNVLQYSGPLKKIVLNVEFRVSPIGIGCNIFLMGDNIFVLILKIRYIGAMYSSTSVRSKVTSNHLLYLQPAFSSD